MKKFLSVMIVFIVSSFLTALVIFSSIYDVVRHGDAPFNIHQEISYIKDHLMNENFTPNDSVESKLDIYVMDYCDFPFYSHSYFVHLIYPQNRAMEKYKERLMAYAAKYRREYPVGDGYFSPYASDAWRKRHADCWALIESRYGPKIAEQGL